jgi:ubiquinone/menaquinone biosynthesis C-methylase UbiE
MLYEKMSSNIIKEYYRVCKIRTDIILHPINYVDKGVFTKKQIDLVMRESGDVLVPKEIVIGGAPQEDNNIFSDLIEYNSG